MKSISPPKPRLTPYIGFCKINRPLIHLEYPGMASMDVTRELGRRWQLHKNGVSPPRRGRGWLKWTVDRLFFLLLLYIGLTYPISPIVSAPRSYPVVTLAQPLMVVDPVLINPTLPAEQVMLVSSLGMVATILLGLFS